MFATDGGYDVLRHAVKYAHLFEEKERNAIITLSHDIEILRLLSDRVASEAPSQLRLKNQVQHPHGDKVLRWTRTDMSISHGRSAQ